MVIKLWLIIFAVCFIMPVVHAEGNISIEEIGADQTGLIEDMNVRFFAVLNNTRTSPIKVNLEFRLDSKNMSRHEGIIIDPHTSKRIVSEYSQNISSGNKTIMVIVSMNDKELANKSLQVTVQKRHVIPEERNNDFFWALIVLAPIIIILSYIIYIIYTRRSGNSQIIEKEKENLVLKDMIPNFSSDIRSHEIPVNSDVLSQKNVIVSYFRKTSEELRKDEDSKSLSDFLYNIASIINNVSYNNSEASELDFDKVKEGTSDLILKFKVAKKSKIVNKDSLMMEIKKMMNEADSKKQFIDVYIPYFLLTLAEGKFKENEMETVEGLISASKNLFDNEDVVQRLRKLREIGF